MSCHVSICIVGFRNAQEVAGCVEALGASEYRDFDVVICENGGPEAFSALRAAVPAVLAGGQGVECLQAPSNLGYAGGVNLAMAARPDAEAWWIVNPDTLPQPQALAALVERLKRGDVEAAGGVLLRPDGSVQAVGGRWHGWLARAESLAIGGTPDKLPEPDRVEREIDYILGASMLVSREFVRRTGPMREDYFLYGEEVEWALRAKRRGLRLGYAPAAIVLHGQGGTTGSAEPLRARPRLPIYLDERNKLHITRDTAPWLLPIAALTVPLLSFLRFAARGAWKQWSYALSGWFAGLRGQRGLPPWLR